ncbi:hypothetical protein [Lactiplantibacillus paraplantarum]|uniref:hypothetical protein n=1 Tax=Lactiplantibacillus paraplantarum TaxID=60520 RepID=UPI003DA4C440
MITLLVTIVFILGAGVLIVQPPKIGSLKKQELPVNKKIGVNYWSWQVTAANSKFETFKILLDKDFAGIEEFSPTYLRVSVGSFNNTKLNYQMLDYIVEKCKNRHIVPIFSFFALGDNNVVDGMSHVNHFEDSRIAQHHYKLVINNTIKRYARENIIWEDMNEANYGGTYWFNQPVSLTQAKDYIKMDRYITKCLAKYVKKPVHLSGNYTFMGKQTIDTFGLSVFAGMPLKNKQVSFHPYIFGKPEQLLTNRYYKKFFKTLNKKQVSDISATELGFGTPNNFSGSYTRRQQSNYLRREILILDALGAKQIVLWTADSTDQTWSIEKSDGTLNSLGRDVKYMLKQLSGYTFYKRLKTDDSIYAFLYKKGNKSKIVCWSAREKKQKFYFHRKSVTINDAPKVFSY